MKKCRISLLWSLVAVLLFVCGFASLCNLRSKANAAEAEYKTWTNTQTLVPTLDMSPAVVQELKDLKQVEEYAALPAQYRPGNVVLTLNESLKVVSGDSVLGDLATVFKSLNAIDILCVFRIQTGAQAHALTDWLIANRLHDVAVTSPDGDVVKEARTLRDGMRGVYDATALTLEKRDDLVKLVADANIARSNVILLTAEQATSEAVEFIQLRFKAVWAVADGTTEFDYLKLIASGVYGIVTEGSCRELYGLYESIPEGFVARPFNNVAHRGVPVTMPENTLEGYLEAYEKGASAIELDVKLSTDGVVYIMHDDTLDRTTDATGATAGKSWTELSRVNVTKNVDGADTGMSYKIPTLKQVLEAFRDKDDIVIFVEIKMNQAQALIEELKNIFDEYECYDKIVMTSFTLGHLKTIMELMPQVPTCTNTACQLKNAENSVRWLAQYNTIGSGTDALYFEKRNLKNRGYLSSAGTHTTVSEVNAAIASGVVNLMNNVADSLSGYAKRIILPSGTPKAELDEAGNAVVSASVLCYDGSTVEVPCKVWRTQTTEGGTLAVLSYTSNSYTLISEPVSVELPSGQQEEKPDPPTPDKPSEGETDNGKSGCNGNMNSVLSLTAFAGMVVVFAVIVRKKRAK